MTRQPPWFGPKAMPSAPGRDTARPSRSGAAPAAGPRKAGPAVPAAPSGLGLASERNRAIMVEGLRRAGVRDAGVLEAMAAVPRHEFVEPALASRAYEDVALPIGHGQTISKPSTVAKMVEIACAHLPPERRGAAHALEIGTGCGYQAAVMARVFGQVVSIERVQGLHERARANLRPMRLANLRLVFGDGRQGVPAAAPYDAIVAAAAGEQIPDAWLEQMKVGARLVAPVTTGGRQALHLVERVSAERWQVTVLDAVRFVPLRTGTT